MPESRRLWADIHSYEDAERALIELGPLVDRKERAEVEGFDPTVRNDLRARVVTAAAERGRSDMVPGLAIPARIVRRPWWPAWVGVAAALAAVLIAAIVIHSHGTGTRPVAVATPSTPALHPPPPAIADLLRAAPPSFQGQGGGQPIPELSGFDVQAGAYRGRLTLSARHLPVEPTFLPAYQLAAPSFDVPRMAVLARHLGIGHPAVQTTRSHEVWDITAEGGPGSNQPLHSLAISLPTGELIYHHGLNSGPPEPVLGRARAVSLARRWLVELGWPASSPVVSAAPNIQLLPPSAGTPWEVSFGWTGVGQAAQTQAALIVTPNGTVIEARLWPPIRRVGHVSTRNIQRAWKLVRHGTVPVAVQGMGQMGLTGAGSLQRITVIHALDTTGSVPYLIPMYRFEGTVHIAGFGAHAWFAVVSAVRAH